MAGAFARLPPGAVAPYVAWLRCVRWACIGGYAAFLALPTASRPRAATAACALGGATYFYLGTIALMYNLCHSLQGALVAVLLLPLALPDLAVRPAAGAWLQHALLVAVLVPVYLFAGVSKLRYSGLLANLSGAWLQGSFGEAIGRVPLPALTKYGSPARPRCSRSSRSATSPWRRRSHSWSSSSVAGARRGSRAWSLCSAWPPFTRPSCCSWARTSPGSCCCWRWSPTRSVRHARVEPPASVCTALPPLCAFLPHTTRRVAGPSPLALLRSLLNRGGALTDDIGPEGCAAWREQAKGAGGAGARAMPWLDMCRGAVPPLLLCCWWAVQLAADAQALACAALSKRRCGFLNPYWPFPELSMFLPGGAGTGVGYSIPIVCGAGAAYVATVAREVGRQFTSGTPLST
jgi:hypothetical protein